MRTDYQIQQEIIREIHKDPELYKIASAIAVGVKNEVVTLFGTVDHDALRIAAEKAAQRVSGVNIVVLGMRLKSTGNPNFINDGAIGEKIHKILSGRKENFEFLKVSIENGWVYLEGMMHWASEKLAVNRLIEKTPGVKRVINRCTVKNRPIEPAEIKKIILAELERSPFTDHENIEVEVLGRTVTLYGEAQSWQETEDAEAICYSVPGVKKVINNLTIDFEIYAT